MAPAYIPDRGDLIWLNFTPQSGREQAGRRPALVLTPKEYNGKVGLAICCPITSKPKQYPFEVLLPALCRIHGAILSDHVKSLDWKSREAEFVAKAGTEVMAEINGKLAGLLNI